MGLPNHLSHDGHVNYFSPSSGANAACLFRFALIPYIHILSPIMRAEEAIEQVRDAICLPARHEDGVPASQVLSGLHPLACSSTGLARRRTQEAFAALRSALQTRALWDQKPALREELLTILKDTDKKRKDLRVGKNALEKCLELLRTKDPFASKCATAAACIVAAAKRAGAVTHEEPAQGGKGPEINVCGTNFLADFHLYIGERRADVKFRNADSDEAESPSDSVVDQDFARLVSAGDFKQLERAFRRLVQLEELDKALGPTVPLRKGLRAFENDILTMQQAELSLGCAPGVRIQQGHGVSIRGAHGLRIAFANEQSALLSVEDAPISRRLVIGNSSPTPIPGTMPPRFQFGNPHSVASRAQYILVLDKPIAVTLKMALELERIISTPGSGKQGAAPVANAQPRKRLREEDPFVGPFPSHPENYRYGVDTSQGKNLPGHVDSFPSLQVLLAPKVFSPDSDDDEEDAINIPPATNVNANKGVIDPLSVKSGAAVTGNGRDEKGGGANGKAGGGGKMKRTGKRARSSKIESEFSLDVMLASGQYITLAHNSTSLVPGITVTKVPVSEPGDIYRVFSILRQQLAFNKLFESCFSGNGSRSVDCLPLIIEMVEVGLSDAPEYLHFGVYDSRLGDFIGLGITVAMDGTYSAKLSGTKRDQHPCTDEKATEILRKTRNVPETIHAMSEISIPMQ